MFHVGLYSINRHYDDQLYLDKISAIFVFRTRLLFSIDDSLCFNNLTRLRIDPHSSSLKTLSVSLISLISSLRPICAVFSSNSRRASISKGIKFEYLTPR